MDKDKALIFNIQRYSVNDGYGIRTNVFFKGCPLRCEWCSNPESQNRNVEFEFNEKECMGCGHCVNDCPSQARVSPKEIIPEKCTACLRCAKLCPKDALKAVGEWKDIYDIVDEAIKDISFFAESGGGVTLSGGEVLVQADVASRLIDEFHAAHVHVAVETTGFASWEQAAKVLEKADLVLYDLKQMDPVKHMKFTGVSNVPILDNARRLAKNTPEKIVFRIPLIGNVNADPENMQAVGKFARELGVKRVDLLPYHTFGEVKYEKLGRKYGCEEYYTPSEEEKNYCKEILESFGLTVAFA